MRTVNAQWSELEKGYTLIKNLEIGIKEKWSDQIEHERNHRFERNHDEWANKVNTSSESFNRIFKACSIISAVSVIALVVLSLFNFAPVLKPTSVFILIGCIGTIIFKYAALADLRKNEPLLSSIPAVDLNISDKWWNALSEGSMYSSGEDVHGDIGEKDLLKQMKMNLPDSYICVRGLLIDRKLDADLMLFAPSGIWILESKYYSGKISVSNGSWTRHKSYYEAGGYLAYKNEAISAFDRQWFRERDAAVKTLSLRMRNSRISENIKGGIVFTHPEVELSIDGSCKASYGRTRFWINEIKTTPALDSINIGTCLKAFDALAEYGHKLERNTCIRSAYDLAIEMHETALRQVSDYLSTTDAPIFNRAPAYAQA